MLDSFDILQALKKLGYIKEDRDPLWWPNSLSFEVVVGAILTQNTKWKNVEKALETLKNKQFLELEIIANIPVQQLALAIKSSGFYNTKAQRLQNLAKQIITCFSDFFTFSDQVDREWLLAQKGIGEESADSILCYACGRDEMTADAYSHRLLSALGIHMENYEDIKYFLSQGINNRLHEVYELYEKELPLNTIYARFHGKIVEYCSTHSYKKTVDVSELHLT